MKKTLLASAILILLGFSASAQQIAFEEYTLENGLHVILHQDKSTPVVVTSVMYHVGTKNENPERTGFAHFFEHLLFEGTKNIGRGEWMKIVSSNGGNNNANTSADRTYFYEVFPSNNLELGLWMEAERLLHPVINQKLPDNIITLPQRLKEAGYVSACIGKWHLGGPGCLPTDRDFDVCFFSMWLRGRDVVDIRKLIIHRPKPRTSIGVGLPVVELVADFVLVSESVFRGLRTKLDFCCVCFLSRHEIAEHLNQ